jgi:hypothetical protein
VRCGANDRTRIVYRDGRPDTELLLRHSEVVADRREDEQRHRIQDEDRSDRNGDLVLVGLHNLAHGRNRAASADGGTDGNKIRDDPVNFKKSSEYITKSHRRGDREQGECKAVLAGFQHFRKVHPEAQPDDRALQQVFGGFFRLLWKGVPETNTDDQSKE